MSSPSQIPQSISSLSALEQDYPAPKVIVESALQKDYEREYQRSIEDPAGFWGDYARRFIWTRKWDQVMEWKGATHKWFIGGRTNITVNALDRHANSEHRNQVAFIWLGEDGAERIVTYGQLYRHGLPLRQRPEVDRREARATASSSTCRSPSKA